MFRRCGELAAIVLLSVLARVLGANNCPASAPYCTCPTSQSCPSADFCATCVDEPISYVCQRAGAAASCPASTTAVPSSLDCKRSCGTTRVCDRCAHGRFPAP